MPALWIALRTTLPTSRFAKRSRETPITRSGRRRKTERLPASEEYPPSRPGSRHDWANPSREKLRSMCARRGHRDRPVFSLSLSRTKLLPRTHLSLGTPRLQGTEVLLYPLSVHDTLHCLFLPSVRALHFHPEVSPSAKSGQTSGLPRPVESDQPVPGAGRGSQPTNARTLSDTVLADDSRAGPIYRNRSLRRRRKRQDQRCALSLCGTDFIL